MQFSATLKSTTQPTLLTTGNLREWRVPSTTEQANHTNVAYCIKITILLHTYFTFDNLLVEWILGLGRTFLSSQAWIKDCSEVPDLVWSGHRSVLWGTSTIFISKVFIVGYFG